MNQSNGKGKRMPEKSSRSKKTVILPKLVRKNVRPQTSIVSKPPRLVSERSIAAPTAIGTIQGTSRPLVFSESSTDSDLRIRVRHREYINDITGSVLYAVQQLNINPGLSSLFPWLSSLSNLFESYIFRSLKFQFRTEQSSAQVGKAMLVVDYDVLDPVTTSKQALLQNRSKAEGPVWVNFDLICDTRDLMKFGVQRFVRQGLAPAGSDLKTYDVGMLNVATQGVTNAPVIGELWVEYDVELITPDTAPVPLASKIVGGGTVSNTAVFGSVPVLTGGINVTALGSTLTFNQAGQYFVEIAVAGTLSVITSNTGTCTVLVAQPLVSSASAAIFSYDINVTASNQTFILTSPTGTVTSSDTRIAQYPFSLG